MFVSVTRLRIRAWRFVPAFALAYRYLLIAYCFDDKPMKAFRGSGAHAQVMRELAEWCDEASYTHWESAGAAVPMWEEAYERLVTEGRLSRVAHPSPDHEARHFPRPRLRPHIAGDPSRKALWMTAARGFLRHGGGRVPR